MDSVPCTRIRIRVRIRFHVRIRIRIQLQRRQPLLVHDPLPVHPPRGVRVGHDLVPLADDLEEPSVEDVRQALLKGVGRVPSHRSPRAQVRVRHTPLLQRDHAGQRVRGQQVRGPVGLHDTTWSTPAELWDTSLKQRNNNLLAIDQNKVRLRFRAHLIFALPLELLYSMCPPHPGTSSPPPLPPKYIHPTPTSTCRTSASTIFKPARRPTILPSQLLRGVGAHVRAPQPCDERMPSDVGGTGDGSLGATRGAAACKRWRSAACRVVDAMEVMSWRGAAAVIAEQ